MHDRQRPEAERSILRAWGEVIRRYRQWKRLSRRELSQRAGLSPVFLGEIERGEKDASSHTLSLIAQGLEAPLSELYLRVATKIDGSTEDWSDQGQTALPMAVREEAADFLDAVPAAKDETAFDLYRIARLLRPDQQVSLLILARSLARDRS